MKGSLELQKALTSILEGMGHDVYDFFPDEVSYPFIILGDDRQSTLDVKNADYVEVNCSLTVFSDYKGNKEVKTILEDIKENCLNPVLDTYTVQGAKVTDSFTIYDKENKVTQGVTEINYKLLRG